MKRIIVTTTARADIEETWTLDVDDESARLIIDEGELSLVLDLLAENYESDDASCSVISVVDKTTGDEEDREVIRAETASMEVPDGTRTAPDGQATVEPAECRHRSRDQ